MIYGVFEMGRPKSDPVVLAGRGEELDTLRRGLRAARSGRTQVVVIEGPAGIGKSALLTAFVDSDASTADVTWLRCDQFEQDLSLSRPPSCCSGSPSMRPARSWRSAVAC